MANDCGAINLSQGYPDFDGPPELRERVTWHMAHGHNQYAPLAGVPALLEQIAGKVRDLYGREVDPSAEVAVTPAMLNPRPGIADPSITPAQVRKPTATAATTIVTLFSSTIGRTSVCRASS